MNNEPVDYPPLQAGGIIENNKPVAFWNKDFDLWEENAIQTYKADGWNIPLYTHPVKELTDEEMKDLIQEYWGDVHIVDPDGYLHEIAFIRAILRKAQEK